MSDHDFSPIGDLEPADNDVVVPLQLTARGFAQLWGEGFQIPGYVLQLVLQPTGRYGLRILETK